MKLWRLSNRAHAADLAGGYGLVNDGRWNIKGKPCIYASTGAALPVLEKRVNVADPSMLPPMEMVEYDVPDGTSQEIIALGALPADWVRRQDITQQLGDDWLRSTRTPLLLMPSAIVALDGVPDINVLINPAHPDSRAVTISRQTGFSF